MNTEAFREALLKDGFTVVERSVAPNSRLEEHDHAWEVKAMITAGSFYVHTALPKRFMVKLIWLKNKKVKVN
jgi:hypothetical protein